MKAVDVDPALRSIIDSKAKRPGRRTEDFSSKESSPSASSVPITLPISAELMGTRGRPEGLRNRFAFCIPISNHKEKIKDHFMNLIKVLLRMNEQNGTKCRLQKHLAGLLSFMISLVIDLTTLSRMFSE